jgi:hypothetical protein
LSKRHFKQLSREIVVAQPSPNNLDEMVYQQDHLQRGGSSDLH